MHDAEKAEKLLASRPRHCATSSQMTKIGERRASRRVTRERLIGAASVGVFEGLVIVARYDAIREVRVAMDQRQHFLVDDARLIAVGRCAVDLAARLRRFGPKINSPG